MSETKYEIRINSSVERIKPNIPIITIEPTGTILFPVFERIDEFETEACACILGLNEIDQQSDMVSIYINNEELFHIYKDLDSTIASQKYACNDILIDLKAAIAKHNKVVFIHNLNVSGNPHDVDIESTGIQIKA